MPRNPLRDIAPWFVEYLNSKGINVSVVLILFGVLFLWISYRDLKNWKKLPSHLKWSRAVRLAAAIMIFITGVVTFFIRQ